MIDWLARWENPPEIKEIHKLHAMLLEAGIEHEWVDRREYFDPTGCLKDIGFDQDYGWQVRVCDTEGKRIISAIQGWGTYGVEGDRIEIMGLLTPEEQKVDGVLGWLTAQEVFDRIVKAEGIVIIQKEGIQK